MEHSQEPTPEPTAKSRTTLITDLNTSISKTQLLETPLKLLIVIWVLRIDSREDHALRLFVPRKGLNSFFTDFIIIESISNLSLFQLFHVRKEVAHLTLWKIICFFHHGLNNPNIVKVVSLASMKRSERFEFLKVQK
jgi:hypothetical protein